MTENCQSEKEGHKVEYFEDEIELIDILRVIWKWKYLIIGGTVAFALIATIISFNMTKIYSIDMVLGLEILDITDIGKNVYIDSPQNIKAMIEAGTFDNDILYCLKNNNGDNIPQKLRFKVSIPELSDIIKVQYETSDIKQGIDLQNCLSTLLLKKYRNMMLNQYINKHNKKLNMLKSEAEFIKKTTLSYKKNVKNIEKRINELTSEIELIKNDTSTLIKERNKLLSKNPKESNIQSVLLYSNTIQHNLELSNNYQNEIVNHKLRKEQELQKIEKSKYLIAQKLNEIENYPFTKDSIQTIKILQSPRSSTLPIKPKISIHLIFSAVVGFLFFLFLSFFLEYLKIYSNKK